MKHYMMFTPIFDSMHYCLSYLKRIEEPLVSNISFIYHVINGSLRGHFYFFLSLNKAVDSIFIQIQFFTLF